MHFSTLKAMAQSPAHYAAACQREREDSTAFMLGRAIHAMVLQSILPAVFYGVRRGKEWEAFKAEHQGIEIVNEAEWEICQRTAEAVARNNDATRLLASCDKKEHPIEWDYFGIPCAGRIDACSDTAIVELKSCECAKPRKFLYDAQKYGYDAQLAWYDLGIGGLKTDDYGIQWRDHFIIAVEKGSTNICQVYQLDKLRSDQGFGKIEDWIGKYRKAIESGEWMGYADGIVTWDGEVNFGDEDGE